MESTTAGSTTFGTPTRPWVFAADVPAAKLAKMMGTSITQIEDTYHRFLRADEERYGSALDSYGLVVGL
jgi:hypothetical protein